MMDASAPSSKISVFQAFPVPVKAAVRLSRHTSRCGCDRDFSSLMSRFGVAEFSKNAFLWRVIAVSDSISVVTDASHEVPRKAAKGSG